MTLSERLADAEAKYHQLMTGTSVVEVTDQNGEKVVFSRASASNLAKYIQQLKDQLNGTSRGPMRAWF